MCKHVAAALYGVGARLDTSPELFFTLRGTDMQELITAASASAVTASVPSGDSLEGDDLSAIFGVEIDSSPASPVPAAPVKRRAAVKKKTASKKKAAVKKATATAKTKAVKKSPEGRLINSRKPRSSRGL